MKLRMTKIREMAAALVALLIVFVFAAFVLAGMGIRLPVMSTITDAVGFHPQQ
jgi:hypothetical protein